MSEFKHDLVDIDENGDIIIIGEKIIYNTDSIHSMKEWTVEPIKNVIRVDKPKLKNAITLATGKNSITRIAEDSLGCFFSNGNNVTYNAQFVSLFSSADSSHSVGISILPSNFLRVCCAFSARKLIQGNWINDKDEYLAPNETHTKFREFELDSVIYSLFHSSSQQSSLRDVDYKGKKWNIKNEFFFMSKDEIENLANDNENDECYEDVKNNGEDRFVYKFIEEHKDEFSKEAIEVLEKAKELVRRSFKYRKFFNDDNPDYQIQNWDCGWYQIKAVLKQYMPNELKEFRELYKKFGEKMKPMVYELGFLRN